MVLVALGLLIVTGAILLYATDTWVRADLVASLTRELERDARVIAAAVPRDETRLNETAHRFGALLGRRVTFIDPEGRVLGDTDFDDASLALLENHRNRPEIRTAFTGGVGTHRRVSASTNRDELKVAIRAWPGVVRISTPVAEVDDAVGRVRQSVTTAVLIGMLFAVGFAWWASRWVTLPLADLAAAARVVGTGAAPRYPRTSIPAIRDVSRALRATDTELHHRLHDLQRGRDEAHTVVNSMVEGVLAATERGEVVLCNEAACRILGYGAQDEVPNLRELFFQRDARAVVDRAFAGEAVTGSEVVFNARTILITGRPLPTGGAVLGLMDVTDLKRLQAVRRDFVANVSHELKTPLTSIYGYAETLLANDADDATRARFLATIRDNAQRMQRLVDDLLDLAKIESGAWQPEIQPLDVRTAVEDAWLPFQERAKERRISFALDLPPDCALTADAEAVREILSNLFDNAVRHTPAGGTITVTLTSGRETVELAIRDTGTGIPAEHLPRVFERFYRVDPGRSRAEGGTGLGLAIVKHLVEGHGGSVTLESEPGRGTTARLRFPAGGPAVP